MGEYADIKSKKLIRFLKWLERNKGVELSHGGRHPYKVTCIHNGNSYPIPSSHSVMNKHIVKGLVEFLIQNQICTKQEFNDNL